MSAVLVGLSLGGGYLALANPAHVFGPGISDFSSGAKPALDDIGTQEQIHAIQQRAIKLMEAEMEMSNLTPATQKEIGLDPESAAGRKLHRQLSQIWVPNEAESSFDEIVSMFKQENGMAIDQTFDTVKLEVTNWQGVQVSGSQATLRFTSYFSMKSHGEITTDAETQWTVILERQALTNAWLIAERQGVVLND